MPFVKKYLKYIVLAALLYMPIFGHLNTLPIRIWDESRLAMNAYEMLHDGDFIVTHYDGSPDMWNTKPPLLIWIQVLFMKMIGVNELAVRLPSAIAACLTCVVLLVFSLRYLNSFWFGFIAIMVLITSHGYINVHASRTGDYDSLLTLLTTLSGLLFFSFCETKRFALLYGFFFITALAVLTKGVGGLLFLPATLIYSLLQKQFLPLLKSKHFYIGLFSFLILVIGYYLIREANNPGYIAAVKENELWGRYVNVLEDHKNRFWYYYNNFIDFQLSAWYLLVPCGFIIGFFVKDRKVNRISAFSLLMVLTYFLIISFAQTKLEWYDVPLYPFLSIVIALFIFYIFQLLKNIKWMNKNLRMNVIPYVFLFLVCIVPYQKILAKTYHPTEYAWDRPLYQISYYLKDALKGKHDLNGKYLLYYGYNANNLFYTRMLNDQGVRVSFKDWKKLDSGDVVIACQDSVKEYLENHYDYDLVQIDWDINTYRIVDRLSEERNDSLTTVSNSVGKQ